RTNSTYVTKTRTHLNPLSNFTINQSTPNNYYILSINSNRRLRWTKPNTTPKNHSLLINCSHRMNNRYFII
ncbi:hypothetical protein DBR06_SOUSAS32710005, partial [Sousa chinensis]